MKKFFSISAALLTLCGCVSHESLTRQGMAVTPVTENQKEQYCKYISFVDGFGAPLTGGMGTAMIDVRNRAGKLGANAIYIIGTRSEPFGSGRCCYSYVDAEALLCELPDSN